MPEFAWFEDPLPGGRVLTAEDAKDAAQQAAQRLSAQVQPGDTATFGIWIARRFEIVVDATQVNPRILRAKS